MFFSFPLFDVSGINATIVRGICKVIGTTLTKYKDPPSQNLVKNLIVSLVQHHPDASFEHFNNVLKGILNKDLASAPPLKASQAAVIALGWSISIASNVNHTSTVASSELPKLIECQAGLYQLGVSSDNSKVSEKATQMLNTFLMQNEELMDIYFQKLLSAEPSSGVIVLMSIILSLKQQRDGNNDLLTANKEKIIDHFVKGLITVKVKPNSVCVSLCGVILKSISHNEFKTQILPALQRAMLRSPEIILQGVGSIVRELEIDVSEFSFDMGKTLIQNLYSKDDCARSEAVESLKQVAMRCSDVKAIEALIKQVFAVLNGSDGKITVAEYRINVLQVSPMAMQFFVSIAHVFLSHCFFHRVLAT